MYHIIRKKSAGEIAEKEKRVKQTVVVFLPALTYHQKGSGDNFGKSCRL